jgi:hypothetical protein
MYNSIIRKNAVFIMQQPLMPVDAKTVSLGVWSEGWNEYA